MYAAEITAYGAKSTVPDNPGAVDAIIYLDDKEIGEVTLLPSEYDGKLSTWGTGLDHWANYQIIRHLESMDRDDRRDAIAEIVDAVRKSARGRSKNPKCPPGKIPIDRKGYTRKATKRRAYTRSDGTRVDAAKIPSGRVARSTFCVDDVGTPGVRSFGAESGPRKRKKPLIRREGKLGGPGYTDKAVSTRHRILARCVKKYGYRSCLGSLLVQLKKKELANRAIWEADKNWLRRTYGGEGSFGPRKNPHVDVQPDVVQAVLAELESGDVGALDTSSQRDLEKRLLNPF